MNCTNSNCTLETSKCREPSENVSEVACRCKQMDNPDILTVILSNADNAVLENLSKTPLWSIVKEVLEKPHFWYLRSQVLTGVDLTERKAKRDSKQFGTNVWKKIYEQLAAIIKSEDPGEIDNLNSVLVITEVFGSSIWSEDNLNPWTHATSIPVLKYMLEHKYAIKSYDNISNAIFEAGKRGSRSFVNFLVDLSGERKRELLTRALQGAIAGDQLELFQQLEKPAGMPFHEEVRQVSKRGGPKIATYLLGGFAGRGEIEGAVNYAIKSGNAKVLEVLFKLHPWLTTFKYDGLLGAAIESGPVELVRVLIEYTDVVLSVKLLTIAVRRRYLGLIKYLLTVINPATEDNEVLATAVRIGDLDIVRLLLEDPELDPNSNLKGVLLSPVKTGQYAWLQTDIEAAIEYSFKSIIPIWRDRGGFPAADLILRDGRIDPEQWDIPTFRTAVWALGPNLVHPIISGFSRGNYFVRGHPMSYSEILALIEEGEDVYSALLRFILVRRPTVREIFEWLADTDQPDVVLAAARSVLDKRLEISDRVVPVREFILALIYPTMKLEEVMQVLKSEGRPSEIILHSCRLVGAYIGYRGDI